MKGRRSPPRRPTVEQDLRRLAERFQSAEIVPRCKNCRKPCCRLDTLVLELDWKRVKALWGIRGSRAQFDALLAQGEGPEEIRPQEGFYYAHRRVCPAYDEEGRRCRVYRSPLKPQGCGDFPVYEEDGRLVADLRCEAVALGSLEAFLRRSLGPMARLRLVPDEQFSFLVRIRVWQRAG